MEDILPFSLADFKPSLVKEWHPTKNAMLSPNTISRGSNKKVWWICIHGHEWQAMVNTRVSRGDRCPFCSNKRILKGFNDLSTKRPDIAEEWHPTRNGEITPFDISLGSAKYAWWLCKHNHEWEAQINSRTKINGSGCPTCNVGANTSFAEQVLFFYLKQMFSDTKSREKLNGMEVDIFIPSLNTVIEYDGEYYHKDKHQRDFDKNFNLNSYRIIRIREYGLEDLDNCYNLHASNSVPNFQNILDGIVNLFASWGINSRRVLVDIKRDSALIRDQIHVRELEDSLGKNHPNIASEWDFSKNGTYTPTTLRSRSRQQVWWLCKKGHSWQMSPDTRVGQSQGCPYCAGRYAIEGENDLATTHPEISSEWDYAKNGDLTPKMVKRGTHESVHWICSKGHEFTCVIKNRTAKRSTDCPNCPKEITIHSKLTYNGEIIGVRFVYGKRLVDVSKDALRENSIYFNLDNVFTEQLYENKGSLVSDLELNQKRTIIDMSDHGVFIRKIKTLKNKGGI